MTGLYESPSRFLWLKNWLGTFLIPDALERISRRNMLKDYNTLLSLKDDRLWELHGKLAGIRREMQEQYSSYDYGNGYYYQSLKSLNISGYRDTEERIAQLGLRDLVRDRKVLDIGSNTGFVLLCLADNLARGTGVELNPFLVSTATEVQKYLGVKNMEFITTSFEEYRPENTRFDVVLSLANHSTYDGNTSQSIDSYFARIHDLLANDGVLVFESHPPQHEPLTALEETKSIIGKYFEIGSEPEVQLSGFLDRNRSYLIAGKKN